MTTMRIVAPPLPERQAEPEAPPVQEPVEAPPAPPPVVDDTTQLPPKGRRRRMVALFLLLGLLVALTTLIIWYLLFRQPLPLPGIPESQVPSYSTSIYGVERPTGVAVSPSGDRIYVTESEGSRIVRIFDGAGNPVGTMRPPVELGGAHAPVYLAIDPITSDVYVTDRPTGSIYIYDSNGAFLREFQPATVRPGWQPLGIAFDRDGNLYVTNLGGGPQNVLVFDRDGRVIRTMGDGENLSFPNGVAVDRSGNVYVTDSNNGRLLVFDSEGAVTARIGRGAAQGNLGLPRGSVVDAKGRLFVVDSSGQGVSVYRNLEGDDTSLEFLGFFGGQGSSDGAFAYPIGIALDERGRVYIADSANDRVQVWSY
jgi:tripartite motif-containing protein 71